MSNIKYAAFLLPVAILTSCASSRIMVKQPLDASSERIINDVTANSVTFGQLDTKVQTDTPYHMYVQSGFYDRNHFSLSITATPNKKGDGFYLKLKASKGDRFVRTVDKAQRKQFLAEINSAIAAPATASTE